MKPGKFHLLNKNHSKSTISKNSLNHGSQTNLNKLPQLNKVFMNNERQTSNTRNYTKMENLKTEQSSKYKHNDLRREENSCSPSTRYGKSKKLKTLNYGHISTQKLSIASNSSEDGESRVKLSSTRKCGKAKFSHRGSNEWLDKNFEQLEQFKRCQQIDMEREHRQQSQLQRNQYLMMISENNNNSPV